MKAPVHIAHGIVVVADHIAVAVLRGVVLERAPAANHGAELVREALVGVMRIFAGLGLFIGNGLVHVDQCGFQLLGDLVDFGLHSVVALEAERAEHAAAAWIGHFQVFEHG